ncbi:UPF0488 protein CG14286 [Lasioglossum baleicum]|uniref:UPF0488 protein CG14286 n=1 Tax=Lasioglossum baleicum TaxID=434251 RepID=UPI003FCCFEF4
MPPKPKPGNKKSPAAKKSTGPPKATNSASSSGNKNAETASGLTQEAEDQFELELCWCIQQLETCLNSGKLSDKQAQDTTRSLNVLKSNMAPLVKKRQVMRNALGNYREKMALEEQKHRKTACSMNFVSTGKQKEKYVFVKKAACKSTKEKQNLDSDNVSDKTNDESVNNVETAFRFNFTINE